MDSYTSSYSKSERHLFTNGSSIKSDIEDKHIVVQPGLIGGNESSGNGPLCTSGSSGLPLSRSRISNAGSLRSCDHSDAHDNPSLECPPSPPLSVYGINQIPLQNRLLSILRKIPGHEEKKGFFPENDLMALMSEEYVRQELEMCFEDWAPHQIEELTSGICHKTSSAHGSRSGFKRIFAILVLCEKSNDIVRFIEENVSDADLPLNKSAPPEELPNFYHLIRKGQTNTLKSFRKWSYTAIWRFEEWQWTTIAPFFQLGSQKEVKHLQLQDQEALPFTQDSRFVIDKPAYQKLEFEGGYSSVFKVDIHPDHHNLSKSNAVEQKFAVKCLRSRDEAEFKREVNTLRKFSGDSHQHLVSLLATYEQFGKFYLIFPWAEADLQGFWMKHPAPTLDHEGMVWLAEQCCGIANGLTKIHHYETWRRTNSEISESKSGRLDSLRNLHRNPGRSTSMNIEPGQKSVNRDTNKQRHFRKQLYGRHGDIKPENILWFRDPEKSGDRGVLRISDFGLTEFSTRHSLCYKRNNQVAHSLSYRPPECDLEGAFVGPSYDIWTLGCLYLELIAWQLGGNKLLQDFRRKRNIHDPLRLHSTDTFFEIVHCIDTNTVGAMVKPAVLDFVLDLHALPTCTEYFHEFLDFVLGQMLVVKSPNPSEKRRMSIEEVHRRLSVFHQKCIDSKDYTCTFAPWPRRRGDSKLLEEAVETDVAEQPQQMLRWRRLRRYSGKTLSRESTGLQ
ncbi:hypothetical protein KVR01_005447 [Diaporthe batatas]|uniref:uncharacterized protein n=1 Tax=Diaporthe batatas TaxID=748121 RepID=UPI001D03D536|nr:uncharacterized protein KVR01_005447 [Diaporthe batatas]KAG8165172.1 hypothetical protein KVR01_005447 [Diaporthe batatas]